MRVRKINDQVLECLFTEEELYFDFDIELDDLFSEKKDQYIPLFIEIMTDMIAEFKMEPKGSLQLQIKLLEDRSLLLTGHILQETFNEAIKKVESENLYTNLQQDEYLLICNDLNEAIQIANVFNNVNITTSSLYKYENKYYLYIQQDKISKTIEYLNLEFKIELKNIEFKETLKEHDCVIIKDNAIKSLNKL